VRKEVEIFSEQESRPVVPVVLRGDPRQVVPVSLQERTFRYLDLRGRWWLNVLSPSGRDELARGIAEITDRDIRVLVNWESRRQRRFALRAIAVFLCIVAAIFFYPVPYQMELHVGDIIGNLRTLEFAEVQDDQVLVTAREISLGPQGGRDYVAYYPDVLESRAWE
jgi:hypothetical protein